MLKTKPLNQLLSQTISPYVSSALLFTPSGALLATATSPIAPDAKKSRTHAALAANIWSNYEQVALQGAIEQSLPASAQQSPPRTPASNGSNKTSIPAIQSLTLELSEYNLHVQLVVPGVLLCLIGPKQTTRQPSSSSSMHSNEGDAVFEGPGSFKSGILGIRSGGATPAAGSMRGTGTTAVGSVNSVSTGQGGGLGVLKAQAQALVDYLEEELRGFELPEGI
ncbi:hypothetical protein L211DRAFT_491341 [Terfezia boudieri ATCC MYA-4762]|uniref:Roadblock/LAMTOR2 domain-containing protein n=1 Tax=Terfezia boudieri ATCC MYA-4762 TaxID=1051890 RepID=A0A3N4LHI3_9PEZI|nr:hypothetical protein L211DRAFT_491341 [Terfezia boudieri ATCC MYA-4762]